MPKAKPKKPPKPRKDFPLTPHDRGGWCKKIRGKTYYFGRWSDPEAALREYLEIKEELQGGIDPRKLGPDVVNLGELCNAYLHNQKLRADNGEISQRTWHDLRNESARMLAIISRPTPVESLAATDFARLRNGLAKLYGPVVLKVSISRIKGMFRWAFESGLIDKPPRYGPDFKAPSAKSIRKARQGTGKLMFSREELRSILEAANPTMRGMVLLAINAGFGNTDVAELPIAAIDLKAGWLDFPRPKTGIARRCPLWPETVKAIEIALEGRPAASNASDANLVFLTQFGGRWVRMRTKDDGSVTPIDSVSREFSRLLRRLEIVRKRLNFYAIRHTFRTVSDEVKDRPAVDHIMGHAPASSDMRAVYVEQIDDARLVKVSNHVRSWLFAKPKKKRGDR